MIPLWFFGDPKIVPKHGWDIQHPVHEHAKGNPQEDEEHPCADARETKQETAHQPCPKKGGCPIKDGHVQDLGSPQLGNDPTLGRHDLSSTSLIFKKK